MAIKPRREDTGVIQHQQVVRAEQVGKVAEGAILPFAFCWRQVHQAGGSPVRQGLLCDQFRWKMVIEVRNKHITD
jgi:hypothetical protein